MNGKEIILDDRFGKYAGKRLVEYISKADILKKVRELAQRISADYRGKRPIFIGILNGSVVFFSDLIREIDIDLEVDFIKLSSYTNETRTSGTVRLLKDISCDISGRDVVIVEDIIDSGLTMDFLRTRLKGSEAKSVRIVTLLFKEHARVNFPIDYIGFNIPDRYVVGYGLDLAQKNRHLKSIYYLTE